MSIFFDPKHAWPITVASFAMILLGVLLVANAWLAVLLVAVTAVYLIRHVRAVHAKQQAELDYRKNTYGF